MYYSEIPHLKETVYVLQLMFDSKSIDDGENSHVDFLSNFLYKLYSHLFLFKICLIITSSQQYLYLL